MIQNVSNCHKSERSRNKNNLPYFIVVLVIIWGLPGLVWSLLGEKLRFLFFMFAESLELIQGRKQFHTAPHLRFDKFHHNKRIALKLQRLILGSCTYLSLFFLMGSRSYFKPSKIPLKYQTRLSWYPFSFEVHTWIIEERGWVRLSTSKHDTAESRGVGLTEIEKYENGQEIHSPDHLTWKTIILF